MKDEHQENIDFVKSRFPDAKEKGGDWCQNVYVSGKYFEFGGNSAQVWHKSKERILQNEVTAQQIKDFKETQFYSFKKFNVNNTKLEIRMTLTGFIQLLENDVLTVESVQISPILERWNKLVTEAYL